MLASIPPNDVVSAKHCSEGTQKKLDHRLNLKVMVCHGMRFEPMVTLVASGKGRHVRGYRL